MDTRTTGGLPADELPMPGTGDMGALLGLLLAKRWWILGSMILGAVLLGVVAFKMQPVYRASVVLTPANAERGADVLGFGASALGGLASGLGLGPKDSEVEEALAVLRSRQFTETFISSQNLLPRLFSKSWDAATGTWKPEVKKPPTLWSAYKYFDTKIRTIIQDKKTGLITVQIDWTDRVEAATWANELVRQLNEEMRTRAIEKAEASTHFLDKEAETTSTVEARDAISRLMEAQVKQRMLATVTHDYSFRVVDKALPADSDDPVKPRKALLIGLGGLGGLALASIFAVLPASLRNRRV